MGRLPVRSDFGASEKTPAGGGRCGQVGLVTFFEGRGGTRRDGGGAHPRLGARGG